MRKQTHQSRIAACLWLGAALSLLSPVAGAQTAAPLPDAAQVGAYAQRLLDEQKIPADGPGVAVLVARGEQLLYQGARGRASIELNVPLAPDQLFRIGSVTKQFAAVALLKLVDEGRAGLDDPLSKFLPNYPKGEQITLRQLLNHSSGIKSYTSIPGYMTQLARRELTTEALVAEFKDQPADFAPGAGWRYNNSGYVLVGAVIEAITGKPWHQYMDDALLVPLRLSRTTYPGETRVLKGMVTGYGFDAKQGVVGDGLISMTQPHAAGALVSSVEDLWRWNLALHGGRVLSPASYARMITPEGAAIGARYGYGISALSLRGQPMLQHGGGIHGFTSSLAWLPQTQVSVVVLRNSIGPGASIDQLSRRLGAFASGRPYPEPKPQVVAVEALRALEGVFTLDGKQTRSLSVEGSQLFSTRSGGTPAALIPLGNDRFAFAGGLAQLQVRRGADGRPDALQLFQDGDGEAELWTRSADLPVRGDLALTAGQQQALLGDYAAPELQIKVFKGEQGPLLAQVPGQPAFPLKADTPLRLYLVGVDARLEFEAAPDGRIAQLTLLQGGARIVMKRR